MDARMRNRTIILIISSAFCLLFLASCGAGKAESATDDEIYALIDAVVPAEVPKNCNDFSDLPWGSDITDLPDGTETVIMRRDSQFAEYSCIAYYTFAENSGLIRGEYRFNESGSLSWHDTIKVYLNLSNHLKEDYGASDKIVHAQDSISSIDELIEAGQGTYIEMWSNLTTSDGHRVGISLILEPNSRIDLIYFYH